MIETKITLEDLRRICGKVTVDEKTGCWNYSESSYHGYRKIPNIGGEAYLAHRFMYQFSQDNLPDTFSDLVVHHKCYNTTCILPYHLDAITQQMNILLGEEYVRERKRLLDKLITKIEQRSSVGSATFSSSELKIILESNRKSGNNFLSILKGMRTVYEGRFDFWKIGRIPGECNHPVNLYKVSIDQRFIEVFKTKRPDYFRYIEDIPLPSTFLDAEA
jgi:hypothetical protein